MTAFQDDFQASVSGGEAYAGSQSPPPLSEHGPFQERGDAEGEHPGYGGLPAPAGGSSSFLDVIVKSRQAPMITRAGFLCGLGWHGRCVGIRLLFQMWGQIQAERTSSGPVSQPKIVSWSVKRQGVVSGFSSLRVD